MGANATGVTPAEARLQELLYAAGHPNPLAEAARCINTRHGHAQRARDWLWAHTAQPTGDPWDDDPDHLERAASDLAAALAGAR